MGILGQNLIFSRVNRRASFDISVHSHLRQRTRSRPLKILRSFFNFDIRKLTFNAARDFSDLGLPSSAQLLAFRTDHDLSA
jgi:hypothetical protein